MMMHDQVGPALNAVGDGYSWGLGGSGSYYFIDPVEEVAIMLRPSSRRRLARSTVNSKRKFTPP